MFLQRSDPWLAYELGHFLFEREWAVSDGLFSRLTARPVSAATTSCAMCHNLPFRSAGHGGNVAEQGGPGLKAPHLFGIGLVETLAIQIRGQILAKFDKNHNGWIDVPEESRGNRAIVQAAPGVMVDFGSLADDDGDGLPDLNDVVQVVPVDRDGHPRPTRPDGSPSLLTDTGIAGYDFSIAFLSSSGGDHQFPSLRLFAIGALETIMGLPVNDPTIVMRTNGSHAGLSNAGAPQLYFPGAASDDCSAVTAGEIDLLEWYLMNHPAPAVLRQNGQTRRGQLLLRKMGCTTCHVEDWVIQPASGEGNPGDRRFFSLAVSEGSSGELHGSLQSLTSTRLLDSGENVQEPLRAGFTVSGLYSDFKYHDMGQRFNDYLSQNGQIFVRRRHRTAPLWGGGSAAPYGHDNGSPLLDDVIRRHGGEAANSAGAYYRASRPDREAVVSFLKTLVLYQPDLLPTDLNGDHQISANYRRAGLEMGPEVFRPELLFVTPPIYRGWVESNGDRYFSYELYNNAQAYGRTFGLQAFDAGSHCVNTITKKMSGNDGVAR